MQQKHSVESALRHLIAYLDYDLYKSIDEGEASEDFPEIAEHFIEKLREDGVTLSVARERHHDYMEW